MIDSQVYRKSVHTQGSLPSAIVGKPNQRSLRRSLDYTSTSEGYLQNQNAFSSILGLEDRKSQTPLHYTLSIMDSEYVVGNPVLLLAILTLLKSNREFKKKSNSF